MAILAMACSLKAQVSITKHIEFATINDRSLALDLYRPEAFEEPPLLVWVHGGAWRRGSKDSMPLTPLTTAGYAIASVEYRLTPEAPFPAQIHDIKAAIRFLRARADHFGIDADRVTIAGASAGGHLAALVGVTNGHSTLAGTAGDFPMHSSDVQAVISFYGASNLTTILSQSTPHGLSVRVPALELLLGAQPDAKPDLAQLASPVFHVDATDPPLLLIHGDQDPQMPINQSHELEGAYQDLGLQVSLEVIHGAAHGGKAFYDADRMQLVMAFLKQHLKPPPQ